MDREARLKLFAYCNELCRGRLCDKCPFDVKNEKYCYISQLQLGLNLDGEHDFADEAVDKYHALARESSCEEMHIAFKDLQFEHCKNRDCTTCPYFTAKTTECALYQILDELRFRLGKDEVETFAP